MGAGASWSRAVWLSAAAALAVPTACAGRSTTLGTESTGDAGSGGTSSGATGGTGLGATGGTGTGGTELGGGSSAGGAMGVAGMAWNCAEIPLEERRCRADSECRLSAQTNCCTPTPIHGVNTTSMCSDPVACDAACPGAAFITDSNESTLDLAEVHVRCDIGEPGAGVCFSYVDLDHPRQLTYCGESVCAPTEVCVHYAPPGGPAPPCVLPFDGGGCADGWEFGTCPSTGAPGCVLLPPGPACALAGASCGPEVTCDCLPPDICGGIATKCTAVTGRDVACVDYAP